MKKDYTKIKGVLDEALEGYAKKEIGRAHV